MSRPDNVTAFSKAVDAESDSISGPLHAKHIVFVDQASQSLLRLLDKVAPCDAPVHIAGETGTGKELIARYIHRKSGRTGPFLAVNCGAISEHLAESELFGHEAGAFTGASGRREGWFEAAHGGTLFLDEIADMPLSLQGKLLRTLQEGEVTRIGSRRTIPIDVRIVSATNVDLNTAVAAGRFRQDLIYRLNLVPVHLLPLRERPRDIAALANHFLQVLSALERYAWPGNIRELENVLHLSLLLTTGEEMGLQDLQLTGLRNPNSAHPALTRIGQALQECFQAPGANLLRDVERRLIDDAFKYCDFNQVRTAELLGISRNVIRTLLKRYGLISDGDVEVADEEAFDASVRRREAIMAGPIHRPARLSC